MSESVNQSVMSEGCLSPDAFDLDEIAKYHDVDFCCVSWQTEEVAWTRITNNQTLVSAEQMDASNLHKVLIRRAAPLFYEDMSKIPSISRDPLVAEHPKFRFYAEAPLVNDSGRIFGSLSIAHRAPRVCQDIKFPNPEWMQKVRHRAQMFYNSSFSPAPRTFTVNSDTSQTYPLIVQRSITALSVESNASSGRASCTGKTLAMMSRGISEDNPTDNKSGYPSQPHAG